MHERPENTIPAISDTAPGPCWTVLLVSIALVAATVVAYWPVHDAGFVRFDDNYYVTDNYNVKQGLSLDGLKWAFTSFDASNWHPLTWLSHMLDVQLFGLAPARHHLVNLLFHCLNALLLLGFLLYTTRRLWPSAFVATLFALHPLHVESVAWISERKDVLCACFWLLTIWSYAFYVRCPSRWRYVMTLGFFALGLMAKPMLVTLPLVLLLLDYWPLARFCIELPAGRSRKKRSPLWPLIVEKTPFVAMAIASVIVTIVAQQRSITPIQTADIWVRLTNAFDSYGWYIWKMVVPTGLAVHYPLIHRPLASGAIVLLIMVATTFLVLKYRRAHPYILTGWLWYMITLVPVIGIVHVGTQSHADRYTYIPLVGLFVIIAWAAAAIAERTPLLRFIVVAVAAAVLVMAAVVTHMTAGYWRDSFALLSHALAVTHDNAKIEVAFGGYLAENGRPDEALVHLQKAAGSDSNDGTAFNIMGVIYLAKGQSDKAMQYFTEATKYNWVNRTAEQNLGAILLNMRRFDLAAAHLKKAVELNPYSPEAYSYQAIALAETGKPDEAARALEKALRFGPEMAIVYYAKGCVLAKAGALEPAALAYQKSISIAPSHMACGNLGNILFVQGKLDDAAASYRRAIAIDPNASDGYFNLAIVLDKLGDREKAIEAAARAIEVNPKDAGVQAFYRKLTQPK
jgi:tetratricopeptide (TPR) repeat protein